MLNTNSVSFFHREKNGVKCIKMARSICPFLYNHGQGYVCRALNSQYIHDDDAKNICSNAEAYVYCVHYSQRNRHIHDFPTNTKRMICPKCNSQQVCETLYLLNKETQTSSEFLAYTCEVCGYTELYKSHLFPDNI